MNAATVIAILKYILVLVIGIFIGRLSMAIQYAMMKKKKPLLRH